MRIELDDNWAIDVEVGSADLVEIVTVKESEGRFKPKPEDIGKRRDGRVRYYGSLGRALQGYLQHAFGTTDASVIPSAELILLLRRLDEIEMRIATALTTLNIKDFLVCSSPEKAQPSTSSPEPKSTNSTPPSPEPTKPSSANPPSADTTPTAT